MSKFRIIFTAFSLLFLVHLLFISSSVKAQWKPTGGPLGAEIKCFLKLNDQLLIGTSRGIFSRRSVDNLEEWKSFGKSTDSSEIRLDSLEITSLIFNGGKLYASAYGNGVLMSEDIGNTWTLFNKGLESLNVLCLISDKNNVYAGTQAGVFVGTLIDDILIWQAFNKNLITQNLKVPKVNALIPFADKIFAGTEQGVFLYDKSNQLWNSASKNFNINITSFALKDNRIFAGTDSSGIIVSADTSATWDIVNGDISKTINVLFSDQRLVFLAGTKRGISYYDTRKKVPIWKEYAIHSPESNVTEKNFTALNFWKDFYFAGTVAGVSKANSGIEQLSEINNGLKGLKITSLTSSNTKIYASTLSGIYVTENKGSSWINIRNNLNDFYVDTIFNISIKDSLILVSTNSGVFKSYENSYNWEGVNNGLIPDVHDFAFKKDKIFAAAGNIYVSVNNADFWTINNSPSDNIQRLLVNGNLLIAATNSDIYYSPDEGATWKMSPSIGINEIIDIIPYKNIFYLYTSKEIYRSDNLEKEWIKISNKIAGPFTALIPFDSYLIAAAHDQIYVYNSNKGLWHRVPRAIDGKGINAFLVLDGDRILAGSDGYSVLERKISELIPNLTRIQISISGDTLTCPGKEIILTASGEFSYQWSIPDGTAIIGSDTSLKVSPYKTTTYRATGRFGNSTNFTVTVASLEECYPLKVYQLLSPNNDGSNDELIVENINYYPENEISIFSKWETKVFHKKNYANDWDGGDLSDGTYIYYLNANGKSYKGDLLIKR